MTSPRSKAVLGPLTRLRLFRALSQKPIRVLWSSQVFSSIGDEIYKVAVVWLAVKMVGDAAGYLAAAQAATVLFFGLLGGAIADEWDARKTMIRADLLRGLVVLIPVVWVGFYPLNLTVLVVVALVVAALSSFFDPALQSVIPRLAKTSELRQATNGLMGTTSRLARMVGPGVVGALMSVFAPIHFFTLDAVSFAVSALSVHRLEGELPPLPRTTPRKSIWAGLFSGFRAIRGDSMMKYIFYGKAIVGGAWCIIIPLGIALLVQERFPGDVRAYGFLLAAYGLGNFGTTLIVANLALIRPFRLMSAGYALMGLFFMLMGLSPNLTGMMICATIAGAGGPMNDLPVIDVIQRIYPAEKLVVMSRFRMAIEYGGIFLSLLFAPLFFRLLHPERMISLAGIAIGVVGVVGWTRFRHWTDEAESEGPA